LNSAICARPQDVPGAEGQTGRAGLFRAVGLAQGRLPDAFHDFADHRFRRTGRDWIAAQRGQQEQHAEEQISFFHGLFQFCPFIIGWGGKTLGNRFIRPFEL
jgi:hypothetical protein